MKQQTAVEMMLDYLQKHGFDMDYEMQMSFLDHEKEHIKTAFNAGEYNSVEYFNADYPYQEESSENYYNETYKK